MQLCCWFTRFGVGFYRLLVYLPQTVSYTIVAVIWTWLYIPETGPIDRILRAFGLSSVAWLTNTRTAMPALILASVWRDTGLYMLIFVAAIQAVPRSLVESVIVDGGGRFAQLRHVILPSIEAPLLFAAVIASIGAIQMFTQSYVMTGGGPAGATRSIVLKIYQDGFQNLQLGYASAEALVLLVLTFGLSLLFIWRVKGFAAAGDRDEQVV